MPVRQLRPQRSSNYQTLVQQLADEWKTPNTAVAEPAILEEFNNAGDLAHVYVVWSQLEFIDRVERGEIIMDAAEAKYGKSKVGSITIAMGLTPAEAQQMGIQWQ